METMIKYKPLLHFYSPYNDKGSLTKKSLHMPRRTVLVIVCGLPGSGKTTFAENLRVSAQFGIGYIHVCYDKILSPELAMVLLDNADVSTASPWKQYRQHILMCIDTLVDSIVNDKTLEKSSAIPDDVWGRFRQAVLWRPHRDERNSVAILIDDNMYYRSMRHAYYQLARKYTMGYCTVYMQCPIDRAIETNRGRMEKVSDDVITQMNERFQPPSPESYHWEKHVLNCDIDSNSHIADFPMFIERVLSDPIQPLVTNEVEREESRLVCSESVLHQFDVVLRKIVSEKIKLFQETAQSYNDDVKSYARSLSRCKTEILGELRRGETTLPLPETTQGEATLPLPEATQSMKDELYPGLKDFLDAKMMQL